MSLLSDDTQEDVSGNDIDKLSKYIGFWDRCIIQTWWSIPCKHTKEAFVLFKTLQILYIQWYIPRFPWWLFGYLEERDDGKQVWSNQSYPIEKRLNAKTLSEKCWHCLSHYQICTTYKTQHVRYNRTNPKCSSPYLPFCWSDEVAFEGPECIWWPQQPRS